jgi:hypothetical protein
MDSSRIFYRPPSSPSSEQIRAARARAWIFIFDCHARNEAASASRPDDGTKVKEDSANGKYKLSPRDP